MIHPKLSRICRVWAQISRLPIPCFQALAFAVFFVAAICAHAPLAQAQAIIETVNGTPITTIDVEQRMKLLRVLHKPAGRDAAIASMVDDTLKLDETSKFKIKASDTDIGQQIAKAATGLKMSPEGLLTAIRGAGVTEGHFRDHFASRFTFYALVQAYNKGVEASETQVREELAKEAGKTPETEYAVRQVVFTLTDATSVEKINNRLHEAEQLRSRFNDCASGLPLARGMDNVAVKEEIRRHATQLNEHLRQLLDKTPTGHLTPPQRSNEGVEMIAVCSKTASKDDSTLRTAISERLLAVQIDADADKKLQELRSHAVIVKK
jgi:peptidyl-prolyl cis-trans isomerase SurA